MSPQIHLDSFSTHTKKSFSSPAVQWCCTTRYFKLWCLCNRKHKTKQQTKPHTHRDKSKTHFHCVPEFWFPFLYSHLIQSETKNRSVEKGGCIRGEGGAETSTIQNPHKSILLYILLYTLVYTRSWVILRSNGVRLGCKVLKGRLWFYVKSGAACSDPPTWSRYSFVAPALCIQIDRTENVTKQLCSSLNLSICLMQTFSAKINSIC